MSASSLHEDDEESILIFFTIFLSTFAKPAELTEQKITVYFKNDGLINKAKEAGIRDKVKIMIGGAPVTEEFCRHIGADAYTPDATSAAETAVEFCK